MSANNLYMESDWVIETYAFISCGTSPLGYSDFQKWPGVIQF
jgi:hypothetical protein